MMQREGVVTVGVGLVCVVGVVAFYMLYFKPIQYTKGIMQEVATKAKAKDLKTGEHDRVDYWGNPVYILREVVDDGDAIQYTVTSSGWDMKFQTDDDISVVVTDVNHTKKIARYIGQRSVRALEGFKEGVKTPDKFHEPEGTDGEKRRPDKKKSWKFWKWKE